MIKNHLIKIITISLVILGLFACLSIYKHIHFYFLARKSKKLINSSPAVVIEVDWNKKNFIDSTFPQMEYAGKLFSTRESQSPCGIMVLRKKINGKVYRGVYIGKGQADIEGFEENEVIVYSRAIQDRSAETYIDIFIYSKHNVALQVKNFTNGKIINMNTDHTMVDQPFLISEGDYHFQLHLVK